MKKLDLKKFKKIKPFSFLLILCIGVVGVTLAYTIFNYSYSKTYTTKGYNVTMEGQFTNGFGEKKVSFKNNDTMPVVIRFTYNELWSKEDSEYGMFTLSNTVGTESVVTKTWTTPLETNFTLGSDGWYYYNKVLDANSSVEVLNSIAFNDTLAQTSSDYEDYRTYDYDLSFNFEAVQADTKAIQKVWNKSATITSGDITWTT